MTGFAERLRELMNTHQYDGEPITDAVLAGILGINRSSVHHWMTGKSYPRITNLHRLSAIFKLPDDDILWMLAKEVPPPVVAFLADTPEGNAAYSRLQAYYRAWRSGIDAENPSLD